MSPLLVAMTLITVSFVAGVVHGWGLWAESSDHEVPMPGDPRLSDVVPTHRSFRSLQAGDADTGRTAPSTEEHTRGRHAVYGAVPAEEHRWLAGRVRLGQPAPGADALTSSQGTLR